MLTLTIRHPDGSYQMRALNRECLPDGNVPREGRLLTAQQFNDAAHLAAHAMSRRSDVTKADYELGREALHHIVGHSVAVENELRQLRISMKSEPGAEG